MYFTKTYFSFKYGTLSTEELVTAGVEAGATSLALTNINSTCDAWDFVLFCQQKNIKPILGVEIPFTAPITAPFAFHHKAGIHTRAVLNDPRSYEPFAPEPFGVERRLLVWRPDAVEGRG